MDASSHFSAASSSASSSKLIEVQATSPDDILADIEMEHLEMMSDYNSMKVKDLLDLIDHRKLDRTGLSEKHELVKLLVSCHDLPLPSQQLSTRAAGGGGEIGGGNDGSLPNKVTA